MVSESAQVEGANKMLVIVQLCSEAFYLMSYQCFKGATKQRAQRLEASQATNHVNHVSSYTPWAIHYYILRAQNLSEVNCL